MILNAEIIKQIMIYRNLLTTRLLIGCGLLIIGGGTLITGCSTPFLTLPGQSLQGTEAVTDPEELKGFSTRRTIYRLILM